MISGTTNDRNRDDRPSRDEPWRDRVVAAVLAAAIAVTIGWIGAVGLATGWLALRLAA